MKALVDHGWVVVPCDAGDVASVKIGFGDEPGNFVSAFRDFDGQGRRTAQVPWDVAHEGQVVWLMVDGEVRRAGLLRG